MVLAAERTDVVAVTLDAVGRDAVPPIAKSPISRCDPFPPVVLNDEGLGIGAGGGVMPTFTAEDAKGGGLTRKGPRVVRGVWTEAGRTTVGGGPGRVSDGLGSDLTSKVQALYGHKEVVLQCLRKDTMFREGRADSNVILEINRPHCDDSGVVTQ